MKKIWDFVRNFIVFAYILLIIFVTICLLSYNDYKVTVFGKSTWLPIIDADLEPDYKVGDLLIIQKNSLPTVKEGDVIFFYRTVMGETTVNFAKVTIAQKVNDVEVTYTVEGGHTFSSSYFIGKADTATVVPKVGRVLSILESKWGFLFLGVFPSLIAFLFTIRSVITEIQEADDDDEEDVKKKKKKSKEKKEKLESDEKNEELKDTNKEGVIVPSGIIKEDVKQETKTDEIKTEESKKETNESEEAHKEEKIEEKSDEKTEDVKEEQKVEEKIDDESKKIVEEKVEEKPEEKVEENAENQTEQKVEEKAETKEKVEEVKKPETEKQKVLTEEQKRALIEAKMKTMTEEEKKALIEAKLKTMTEEQKRALIEAKRKKLDAEKNNK